MCRGDESLYYIRLKKESEWVVEAKRTLVDERVATTETVPLAAIPGTGVKDEFEDIVETDDNLGGDGAAVAAGKRGGQEIRFN